PACPSTWNARSRPGPDRFRRQLSRATYPKYCIRLHSESDSAMGPRLGFDHVLERSDPMTMRKRALLLALVTLGVAGANGAHAETFRCQQADGGVLFQQTPCALADLVNSEPARPAAPPVVAAPPEAKPAVATAVVPAPKRPALEPSVSTPAPVHVPAAMAHADPAQEDGFVKPTRRKREVL